MKIDAKQFVKKVMLIQMFSHRNHSNQKLFLKWNTTTTKIPPRRRIIQTFRLKRLLHRNITTCKSYDQGLVALKLLESRPLISNVPKQSFIRQILHQGGGGRERTQARHGLRNHQVDQMKCYSSPPAFLPMWNVFFKTGMRFPFPNDNHIPTAQSSSQLPQIFKGVCAADLLWKYITVHLEMEAKLRIEIEQFQ